MENQNFIQEVPNSFSIFVKRKGQYLIDVHGTIIATVDFPVRFKNLEEGVEVEMIFRLRNAALCKVCNGSGQVYIGDSNFSFVRCHSCAGTGKAEIPVYLGQIPPNDAPHWKAIIDAAYLASNTQDGVDAVKLIGEVASDLVSKQDRIKELEDALMNIAIADCRRDSSGQLNTDWCVTHQRSVWQCVILGRAHTRTSKTNIDSTPRKSADEELADAVQRVYERYGTNLQAFFEDCYAEQRRRQGDE